MAGKFKSLGLAGARKAGSKAMRKLFGQESQPANGGSCDVQTSAGGNNSKSPSELQTEPDLSPDKRVTAHSEQKPNHTTANRGDSNHIINPTTADTDVKSADPQQRDISPAPLDASIAVSSTSTSDDMALRNLQQQDQQQRQTLRQVESPASDAGKENQPPLPPVGSVDNIANHIRNLALLDDAEYISDVKLPTPDPTTLVAEKLSPEQARHLFFVEEALDMARLALKTNETPVGCVLVHKDKVISRGMNATNVTRNGTRHAEFMALSALLSYPPKDGPRSTCLRPKIDYNTQYEADDNASTISPQPDEGNEDGSKGHLYPYGQKEHPDYRVDRSIVRECTLYVTVEPCIMCASLLRQMGIKKVYFGAVNDKFGGTGGVFSIHANSAPVSDDGQTASAHPQTPPTRLPRGGPVLGTSFPPSGGDGGNVEPGFEIEGGWGRDEAVGLLRRFYVQENERAPVPRKKEGRAARLAAIMDKDDSTSDLTESAGGGTNPDGDDGTVSSTYGTRDRKTSFSDDEGPLSFRDEDHADRTIQE